MEGGIGLALLTLETRLDGMGSSLASLRIGDYIVPVLPGTSRLSRVSVPLDTGVSIALIPAPPSRRTAAGRSRS